MTNRMWLWMARTFLTNKRLKIVHDTEQVEYFYNTVDICCFAIMGSKSNYVRERIEHRKLSLSASDDFAHVN